jgi:hypothetical protein
MAGNNMKEKCENCGKMKEGVKYIEEYKEFMCKDCYQGENE